MDKLTANNSITLEDVKKAVAGVYELERAPSQKSYIIVVSDNIPKEQVSWLAKAINRELDVKAVIVPKSWLPEIYECPEGTYGV